MISTQEIELLEEQINKLLARLTPDVLIEEKIKLEAVQEDPGFWNNHELAVHQQRELSAINSKLEQINKLKSNLENLKIAVELKETESAKKIEADIQKQMQDLEIERFFTGKFDSHGAILSINSGAGGVDAEDWAAMVLSMYQAFAKNMGWESQLINLSAGSEGGVKSASIEFTATAELSSIKQFIYGFLKEEIGVHRLVRISPFNSGSTRETSFASVEVIPTGLDSEIQLELDEKDLRFDYFMSSGKGGQGVNTTYSAVRVVHIPTNTIATCQNERSQLQNKQQALKVLKNRLIEQELSKQQQFLDDLKGGGETKNEFGGQIRNYVLHPYKMVKDTRSGYTENNVAKILEKGDLEAMIIDLKESKKT